MTRWHLLNLPVIFDRPGSPTMHVVDVLLDWPEPQLVGFLLHRRWRTAVLPWSEETTMTPFGIQAVSNRQLEHWSPSRIRTHLSKTATWIHAPVVDSNDQAVGVVRDLILDSHHRTLEGLVLSRGLLLDLWAGSPIISTDDIDIGNQRCIKLHYSGDTLGVRDSTKGGGMWTL